MFARLSAVLALVVCGACGGSDATTAADAPDVDAVDAGAPRDGAIITSAPIAASAPKSGWFHTRGRDIVDSQGNVVRLTGINWFGLETATFAPHGLWARPLEAYLDDVRELGYNVLRIPFSTQMLDAASVPSTIDYTKNPSLKEKRPIELLDAIVAGARARGLRVIIDRHRPHSSALSPLWYTDQYSEGRFIDDWRSLAKRYHDDPTVIGFDLHNEPHGAATWGSGDTATDWRLAAERTGAAIQEINPELLVIVEGVETVDGKGTWWGGNLRAAGRAPVRLPVLNHVVYSPHEYPASVAAQPWFSAPDYPANLARLWEEEWAYLVTREIAPVWIGELGTKYETDSDRVWLATLAETISRTNMSFAYWALNPDSSDTGGILKDDWLTRDMRKQSVILPLLAPPLQ